MPKTQAPDDYFRLPQVVLNRRNPRHMELLEAMHRRGYYGLDGSRRMTGYAELVRSLLFWYFGLSPWEMPVGAAETQPPVAAGHTVLPVDDEETTDVAESDDLVASYVFGWGTR
jgi:hypothetical protein